MANKAISLEQMSRIWGKVKTYVATAISGLYTKPSGGIPKSDLSTEVQTSLGKADTALQTFTESDPTVPAWAKQPTKPSYTASEVGALPADTPIPTPDVFFAEYGVTTKEEIISQYNAGKLVVCLVDGVEYHIAGIASDNSFVYFGSIVTTTSRYILLTNSWTLCQKTLEGISDKVSDIFSNRESTSKYPNTKAVFDAIGKYGVISQTQTWTGSNETGYDYTMSNLVYGEIPRANIDLYEAAGAVFNETTGYFELNGLTDISYDEMRKIYADSIGGVHFGSVRDRQFATYKQRTTVILSMPDAYGTSINFMFQGAFDLEVAYVGIDGGNGVNLTTVSNPFKECRKLRRIIGTLRATSFNDTAFQNTFSLEEVRVNELISNIKFSNSSPLTLASIVYMVNNATNTSDITITLHATAFARCQADTTEYTYNGNTYIGIIAYAAAKSITIQSA